MSGSATAERSSRCATDQRPGIGVAAHYGRYGIERSADAAVVPIAARRGIVRDGDASAIVTAQRYLVVSADVVVAAEAASARRLAAGYRGWVYSIRSGAGATEYRSHSEVAELTEEQHRVVADLLDTQFDGTPETVTEGSERCNS